MGDVDPEEIEDLINELEDLSDSGPDVDTISVGSTPKPSLRYLLTWVTWWLISVGPGGSSLEMLLASVASARSSHQSRKSFRRVQS